ncbi:MAG: hypothetical protein P4N41_04650 [Negativicutes bacterium]|nr:hypothetical protein [Negativicutes bacterium]
MPGPLNPLLRKLEDGDTLLGTYYRRAVEDETKIRFDRLIVRPANGGEFWTTDPAESERFFQLTNVTGMGANSGYCREESCYYYESLGYWQTAAHDH